MNHIFSNRMRLSALAVVALFVCAGRAQAKELNGSYSSVTIYDDSRLTGDVTCTAEHVSCIVFGASHIKLSLNGHTITGPVNPLTDLKNCSSGLTFGLGIEATDQNGITIEGPGVIQHFESWGILLESVNLATVTEIQVTKVTVAGNCWAGLQTIGVSDSYFEENNLVNNALGSSFCGGICNLNSSKNVIRKCTFSGNGTVNTPDAGNADFGVSLEGSSNENRIEENDIEGNANGVFVFDSSTGNVIRHNTILGNPPVQVSAAFPSTGPPLTPADEQGFDIQDISSGANTFEDNVCLTYSGPASPAPCPNVAIKHNDEATIRMAKPLPRPEDRN